MDVCGWRGAEKAFWGWEKLFCGCNGWENWVEAGERASMRERSGVIVLKAVPGCWGFSAALMDELF